jgi:DNA polymerase IV
VSTAAHAFLHLPAAMPDSFRKIIHIDMDCFYAAVEQRDNPEYRGKPLIVGGMPDRRGVVATASYEARRFGVKSAMSTRKALELCPEALIVFPRFEAYKNASRQIREIFSRYTDLIEPLSLDEAFLDVTENKKNISSAIQIAREIKASIREELQLTASAGVSTNKFVAKVASDMQKPDGLTFIAPDKVESFIEQLPVEKFFGVGKVTAAAMHRLGLHTGADLKRMTEKELIHHFGKTGSFYYRIARGLDDRPVTPDRQHKSLGAENTFLTDLAEGAELDRELGEVIDQVFRRMEKYALYGRTVTLKIKFSDFRQITRSKSFTHPVKSRELLTEAAHELLHAAAPGERRIRLIGVSLSSFDQGPDSLQLTLDL